MTTIDRSPETIRLRLEMFQNLREELQRDLQHIENLPLDEKEGSLELAKVYAKLVEVLNK